MTEGRYVEKTRAASLDKLHIRRIGDLLYHAPLRYLDLSRVAPIGRVRLGDATVTGTVHDIEVKRVRKRLTITEVAIADGTGTLLGVWFNQPWVENSFRVGQRVAFAGTVKHQYGMKQIVQPLVERLGSGERELSTGAPGEDAGGGSRETPPTASHTSSSLGRIIPIHPTTEKLSLGWLRRMVAAALDDYAQVPEWLPGDLMRRHQLPPVSWALRNLHFPQAMGDVDVARRRLAYGELLDLQLLLARRRHRATVETRGFAHSDPPSLDSAQPEATSLQRLLQALPFRLTDEQQRAADEILRDMVSDRPMQRMLLGDVGTGKTAVAAVAIAVAADSKTQAAMMAPTEVLAQQYANKLGALFDAAGISWTLLTGSTTAGARAEALAGLADGSITVAFGTHALLESDVVFRQLTLAIIDEQHRFGVEQRKRLTHKHAQASADTDADPAAPAAPASPPAPPAAPAYMPDTLVMSATPIPRTLTLALFGDLALSYLRYRPVAGAGVSTHLVKYAQAHTAYKQVRTAVAAGQQAYIVCALVDESEKIAAQSALRTAEALKNGEFSELRVAVLTGRMRPGEKAQIMADFRAGNIDVLVSTTVIEVGVDVANATIMVILDADRYGLAQLHQLRGRVGRGQLSGQVWLVSDNYSDVAQARFKALLETDDGFRLAELDLELRGAGELLGTRQSGLAQFKVADLVDDADLAERARADAFRLIADDPQLAAPELALLSARVQALERSLERLVS